MAMRVSRKPLLESFPNLIRFFNSPSSIADASPLNFVQKPASKSSSSPAEILNLDDGKRLFSSIPTQQMLNSLLNLQMVSFDPLMDIGIRVMNSSLLDNRIVRRIVLGGVKRTIYKHFCAGEGLEEASRTLQGLWDSGLRGILDYGLEDAETNEDCDLNLEEFIKTVEMTGLLPSSSVSFACVKISAICPISLLGRISDLLRWQYKDPSFNLPWKLDSLPVITNSSPLYHTLSKPNPLSPKEEQDLQLAHQRLSKLCSKCLEIDLPLLVDAEYTAVQPAIDYLTYSAAIQFNGSENPIVYGTIQAYLRDSKERLVQIMEAAESKGLSTGFKLVRGAYLARETKVASSLGAVSPIHQCIGDTHTCYNECTSFMLEKIAKGCGSVVLATHNLESGKVAAAKVEELRIGKGNPRVQFAQLKGMADGLSMGLRNAGFNVSKYLPFGPVDMVIPYLLRRAEENRGLLSASALDRSLMSMELKRRIKAQILGAESEKMVT